MTRTLIRRGWLVPLITVAVAAIAYLIATSQSRTYTSDATLVVPSGVKTAGPQNPSNATDLARTPSDATDLARTYAAQIPEDDRVVGLVAKGLHASSRGVRDSLKADAVVGTNPGSDTALVTISYGAGSPAKARSGASLASAAVTGAHPAATGITPGSLELVRAPDNGSSSSLGTTAITIGGAIVGFALALLLLLTWERADRRIDRPEDLAEEANCPATRLRGLSTDARSALLRRWGDYGSTGLAEVALMAVDGRTLHRMTPSRLSPLVPQGGAESNGHGNGNGHHNGSPARIPLGDGVVLSTPTSPADDPASQETARKADVAILVARRGAPAVQVRKAVRSMEEMGVSPSWALLLG
jgi:capsular polysaccharide biosynthesis protein